MRIQTNAYFQPLRNHSALLLQHYQVKTVPLCFACICYAETPGQGKAAAYLTEQLLHWFRALSWKKLIQNPEKSIRGIETKLKKVLENTLEELISSNIFPSETQLPLAGLFSIGEHFLLFLQGTPQIFLMNQNLGKGTIQCISDNLALAVKEHITFHQGLLQADIGLLLATDTFCSNADRQELKECLYVKDVQTEGQANKHLQELGHHGEERGSCHMAAVLIQTFTDEEIGIEKYGK